MFGISSGLIFHVFLDKKAEIEEENAFRRKNVKKTKIKMIFSLV